MPVRPIVARVVALVCCSLLAGGGIAVAQVQPGARLRLTHPCDQTGQPGAGGDRTGCRSEGTLVLWQGDTLTVASGQSITRYGVGAISRLQVSRGTRSHRLAGAGIGFLAGGGVAAAVLYTGGSTSQCDQSANQDAMSTGECIGLTALGGLAGAGLGAIVGGFFRTERWEDVPLEQLRVSLGPLAGRRLGLALQLVF
jgi:hypothetical protein